MTATAFVRTRIDGALKEEAAAVLATMGLTVSGFVCIGLTKVAHEKALPFDMHVPNHATRAAMTELEAGKGERFKSADELFKALGI